MQFIHSKWTNEEINTLVTMANRGDDDKTIANTLNRSLAAVEQRRFLLRLNKAIVVDFDRFTLQRETLRRRNIHNNKTN